MTTGIVRRGQYRVISRGPLSRIRPAKKPIGAPHGPGDIQNQAVFEAQNQPYYPASTNKFSPDISITDTLRAGTHISNRPPRSDPATMVSPYGLYLSGKTITLHAVNKLKILLQQNIHRKRFIIINPNAAAIISFTFKNCSALIPIFPQSQWDESGSSISLDDLWVQTNVAGATISVYEGVE